MNGLKTCWEVFQYMNNSGNKLFSGTGDGMDDILEGGCNGDGQEIMVSVCFNIYILPDVLLVREVES